MCSEHPDLMCITETWLNKEISNSEIALCGYKIAARKDRTDTLRGRGGGTIILSRNVSLVEIHTTVPGVCGVRVGAMDVYCCYLSPNADDDQRAGMNSFLSTLERTTVIVGDFNHPNVDWSTGYTSGQRDWNFVDATHKSYLAQYISDPTHDAGNILDLLFTNDERRIVYTHVRMDLKISDHFPIQVGLMHNPNFQETSEAVLNYAKAD